MKIHLNGEAASLVDLFKMAAALRLPPWECGCGVRNSGKHRFCGQCGEARPPQDHKEPPASVGGYEDNYLRR